MTTEVSRHSEEFPTDQRPLYRLALLSLLGGSTSLLPLPVIDDWAFAWVRRRLILEVCRPPISLGESSTQVLMDRGADPDSGKGCVGLVLRTPLKIVTYIIGRLFRKIFFFLAIKESTDRASELFHEGYLLSAAATSPRLHPRVREGDLNAVRQLAYVVVETLQGTDTSPVRMLIVEATRGSWRLLFAAARRLQRFLRREGGEAKGLVQEEEQVLQKPAMRLTRLLQDQLPYFSDLEQKFTQCAEKRQVFRESPST